MRESGKMQIGYQAFEGGWGRRARLAWDTIQMKPTKGIPARTVHVMDVPFVEEMTGHAPGYQTPKGRYCLALKDGSSQLFPVHRHGQGLAYARVCEGWFLNIKFDAN